MEPGSEGVLWWGDYTDEARGRGHVPPADPLPHDGHVSEMVETFGSAEFYSLRVSPDLVGTARRP